MVIAVEDRLVRLAGKVPGQFPADIHPVQHPVIEAAHAEDRHDVRRIPDEDGAAVPVAVQQQRIRRIDRPPFQFPRRVIAAFIQHLLHGGADVLLAQCLVLVFVVAKLIVDAPDIVGLLMHQHGRSRPRVGVEQGETFDRHRVFHLDVGDDVAPLEILPGKPQPHHRADRRPRPVGGEKPVRAHLVGAVRIAQCQGHAVTIFRFGHAGAFGAPAHVDQRVGGDPVMQEFLDILLLDIIHRAVPLGGAVGHEEFQDLPPAEEAAPRRPGKRFVQERVQHIQQLQRGEAGPRDADGARAVIEGVLGIDDDRGLPVPGQRQRRDHADRSGPDDRDGRAHRQPVACRRLELRIVEIERFPPPLAMRFHAHPPPR